MVSAYGFAGLCENGLTEGAMVGFETDYGFNAMFVSDQVQRIYRANNK